MTREERAQRWLADYFDQKGHRRRAEALRAGRIISMNNHTVAGIMLAFAEAESAAMRERSAVVADTIAEIATTNDAQFVAAGASASATAIRSLPATGEVGRG